MILLILGFFHVCAGFDSSSIQRSVLLPSAAIPCKQPSSRQATQLGRPFGQEDPSAYTRTKPRSRPFSAFPGRAASQKDVQTETPLPQHGADGTAPPHRATWLR